MNNTAQNGIDNKTKKLETAPAEVLVHKNENPQPEVTQPRSPEVVFQEGGILGQQLDPTVKPPVSPMTQMTEKTETLGTGRLTIPSQNPEAAQAGIKAAANKLKGILLPPTFTGIGLAFEAELPPFERPKNQNWFQTHKDISFSVLTFKGQDETLYVADISNDSLVSFLASRHAGRPTRVYPYALNDGRLGFWPLALDGTAGRPLDEWNKSGHFIAEAAKASWVTIMSGAGAYKMAKAPDNRLYGEPKWPADMDVAFARAIEGVLVHDLDHPEMRRWQGLQ